MVIRLSDLSPGVRQRVTGGERRSTKRPRVECSAPALVAVAHDAVLLRVHEKPHPKGSLAYKGHRGGRAIIAHDNTAELDRWTGAVSAAAMAAGKATWGADAPIAVAVTHWMPRPGSIPKKRVWVAKKPDDDKLARATIDGLVPLIPEDSRVVAIDSIEVYATEDHPPGALIVVVAIDDTVDAWERIPKCGHPYPDVTQMFDEWQRGDTAHAIG